MTMHRLRAVAVLVGAGVLLALLQFTLVAGAVTAPYSPLYLPVTTRPATPAGVEHVVDGESSDSRANSTLNDPWATVYVIITEEGFVPEYVTLKVGSRVVWSNDTEGAVHLVGEFGSRIYLPLIMRQATTVQATIDSQAFVPAAVTRPADGILIPPGGLFSNDFFVPGSYIFEIQERPGQSNQIDVELQEIDPPALAWATGPAGVLLRWRWPRVDERSQPVPQPIGYNVYRDGQLLEPSPVSRITDPAEAEALLGSHWAWIQDTYTDVTTIAELHAFLDDNPLAERWLADQRYPVALLRGLGYLDETVLPVDPAPHTYRVEAVFPGKAVDVGDPLTVQNQGVTAIDPPSGLQSTSVISEALRRSPDWAEAQRNRQGHAAVHLVWDLPTETGGAPDQWVTSYDVYRAGPIASGQDPETMRYVRVTGDDPVVPMEDHEPVSPFTDTTDAYAVLSYARYDSYYVDKNLTPCETYAYRIAGRDLLGQPGARSAYVTVDVPDTMPPEPPRMLTPTVNHESGTVLLTWEPVADAAAYEIYRSEVLTASWPDLGDCSDPSACWTKLTDLGATSFVDSPPHGQRYWYVVRALDVPCRITHRPNMSAPSNAVTAMLQDRVPPAPPVVKVQPNEPIQIDPAPDTTEVLLYCVFDDGSEPLPDPMLIESLPVTPTGSDVLFDIEAYYVPAVPVTPTCSAQALDANGNTSAKTAFQAPVLCPAGEFTLTPPVIVSITTQAVETGWAAEISWDIEADQPGLQWFRVRRQDGDNKLLLAQVGPNVDGFLDTTVKNGVVYSYTVSAVRVPGCGQEFGPEIRSAPRLYQVVPPLDRCTRQPNEMAWHDSIMGYEAGTGTHLAWDYPFGLDQAWLRTVVYRSLTATGGYVAITPPFDTKDYWYLDTDAEHGDYWYVVAALDWAKGEILAETRPWSPNYGIGAASAEATAADAETTAAQAEGSIPRLLMQQYEMGSSAGMVPEAVAASETRTIEGTADTYVASDAPDVNFGDISPLQVWYSSDGGDFHGLVRFDLSDIPNGASIEGARFHAYSEEEGGFDYADIQLHRITGGWEEMGVTWNDVPLAAGPCVTASVGAKPGWAEWDVTTLVREWTDGTYPNHGLKMVPVTDSYVRAFTSRESERPPSLRVQYTPPPETLQFGVIEDNPFTVTGVTYQAGSTPDCLTGSGTVALGGEALGATYYRAVNFSCIAANYETGVVTSGSAEVVLPAPLTVSHPDWLDYSVQELTLNEISAWGEVGVTLPSGLLFHDHGIVHDPIQTPAHTIRQDLTFAATRAWASACGDPVPHYAIEMDPLPLLVVPQGEVFLFHTHINLGAICTRYEDRYNGTRPVFPLPDANDGYLRPNYYAEGAIIWPVGLSAMLETDELVNYTTVMPYGFEISATGPTTFEIWENTIEWGAMENVTVELDYHRVPVTRTIVISDNVVPFPDGLFVGSAPSLTFGLRGSLFGAVTIDPPTASVEWGAPQGDKGFVLQEPTYFLYLPPVQTAADRLAWVEAEANALDTLELQAGLNLIIVPPDTAPFTWYHCEQDTEITFPEGVAVDVYLRRGGISDVVEATISLGNPVEVLLYGYSTAIKSFRLAFCDNYIYDSDVSADVDLPYPTNHILSLVDIVINPSTACVDSGRVPETTLTLDHWDITMHPRAGEFRKQQGVPIPPEWTRALWIIGTMDVPHLAPPDADNVAPIPTETAFRPDGTILENKLVYNKANYRFDGFPLLLSAVEPSDYLSAPPVWHEASNLAPAPNVGEQGQGFITVTGNLVEPIFGTLKGDNTKEPPDLFVLGWDDYVGFSDQPAAQRTWTVLTDITWGFRLIYAQHWDTATPRGTFVGFRSDNHLVVVKADQALILSSIGEDSPRADLLLGLSAGNGVLRALAETMVNPVPATLNTALKTKMKDEWVPRFSGMDEKYVGLLEKIWGEYAGGDSYAQTTSVIDAWADKQADKDKDIPDEPAGGGTTPVLSLLLKKTTDWDVQLKKLRGQVTWKQDQEADYHFDECRFSLWFRVKNEDDKEPVVEGERLTFRITRDAEYVLEGYDVTTRIQDYPDINSDFVLAIRTEIPSVEGAITIKELEVEGVMIEEAAATLGVGDKMLYLGALVDNAHPVYSDKWRVGGAFLVGILDPNSLVLQGTGFKSILDDINATGATKANGALDKKGRLAGGYGRFYGELPIYEKGCYFRISAGGEVAVWYFAATGYTGSNCDRYGGRLRGYIHGKLLCVVSGRGDLTLEMYRKPVGGSCGEPSMRGQFWAAGGIGFCDPGSWKSWESRWWGDSWCWTAGAVIDAEYDGNANDWDWSYDADYE